MGKSKNEYHKSRTKKSTLGFIAATHTNAKGNLKSSALETLIDLGVGVIGGGIVGSLIGKTSLVWGLGATGIGHYANNRYLTAMGMGMMAANGFQNKAGLNGVEGPELEGIDGMKERFENFKNSFSEKLFLDKVMKKVAPAAHQEGANGVGNVQYFTYPNNETNGVGQLGAGEVDMSALDHINKQIADSAKRFSQTTNGFGALEEMNGSEEMSGSEQINGSEEFSGTDDLSGGLGLDPTSSTY
jgi:hypothetical protein